MSEKIRDYRRLIIAAFLNGLLVILELVGMVIPLTQSGPEKFIYYTIESNLLALAASAFYVLSAVRTIHQKQKSISKLAAGFRFMAAVCLMVTFLVVSVGLLLNMSEEGFYEVMIEGSSLYVHLVCPLLSLVSFLFFENGNELYFFHCALAAFPTFLYGIVSMTMNILRIWYGPYVFLHVYEQPLYMSILWIIIIDGGALLLSCIMKYLNSKIFKTASVGQKSIEKRTI